MSINRGLRFDTWWRDREDLRLHRDVRFLRLTGEATECMELITSQPFEGLGGVFSISGGVSLFSRIDSREEASR